MERLIFDRAAYMFDLQRFADGGAGSGSASANAGGGVSGAAPASGQQDGGAGNERPPEYDSLRKRRRLARQQGFRLSDMEPANKGTGQNTGDVNAENPSETENSAETEQTSEQNDGTQPSGDDRRASDQKNDRVPLSRLMEQDPEYRLEFQEMWNKRHKDFKETQTFIDRMNAVYGTDSLESLSKAMDEDADFWELMADKSGMTRAQLMDKIKRDTETAALKRENEALRGMTDARDSEAVTDEDINAYRTEGEAMAARYEGFNLISELKNPKTGEEFRKLVKMFRKNGFDTPVERAYRMIHMDEITAEAVSQTMRRTENNVTRNIQARGSRPRENGASGSNTPAPAMAGLTGRSPEARERRRALAAKYL